MAQDDEQVLIVVDIYSGFSESALEKSLPSERRRLHVLQLSKFGAPKLDRPSHTKPIDWSSIGEAIEKIAVHVHEIQDSARPQAMELYIGGRGPLAAFVHLGFAFSKSVQKVVVLNTPGASSDAWEAFPMDPPPTKMVTHDIFDKIIGFPDEPSPTTGRIGLVVDAGRRSKGDSEPTEVFEKFITQHKQPVGTIVQLRSYDEKLMITDVQMPAIVRQFLRRIATLPHLFPKRSGLALFVGGPTQIAVALGRAINANVLVGDVWLSEYIRGQDLYEYVYKLPFISRVEPEISNAPEDNLARSRVLSVFIDALEELRNQVDVQHIPKKVLREGEGERFVSRLRKLRILREHIEDEPFQIRVQEGECSLGAGILQSLVLSSTKEQKDLAKLVLLHEMLHDWQSLRSTNHSLIGRAGFVLEHIDYLADAFSVQTLVNVDLDRGGAAAKENVRQHLRRWLERVLHGIEAFDKAEQGVGTMEHLTERRLRRYLLWHVQWARARTVETIAQFERLMGSSLTVELAPLAGWIDVKRWEKVVKEPLPDTELCIAVDGVLIRAAKRQDFDPNALLDAVRSFDRKRTHKEVNAVVDEERAKLMPWISEN